MEHDTDNQLLAQTIQYGPRIHKTSLERLWQWTRAQGLYFENLAFAVLFDNTNFEQINRKRFQAAPPTGQYAALHIKRCFILHEVTANEKSS